MFGSVRDVHYIIPRLIGCFAHIQKIKIPADRRERSSQIVRYPRDRVFQFRIPATEFQMFAPQLFQSDIQFRVGFYISRSSDEITMDALVSESSFP